MKRLLFMAALTLASTVHAHTQASRVDRIEIVEYGIFQRQVRSRAADPNSPGGEALTVGSVRLIQSTTTIPARIGTAFGFRYRVIGQPAGSQVALKIVSHFPPPGFVNSTTKQMQLRYEQSVTKLIGDVVYTGWVLDEPSDLIAGKWIIEIWYGNRKLVEQHFTAVKP